MFVILFWVCIHTGQAWIESTPMLCQLSYAVRSVRVCVHFGTEFRSFDINAIFSNHDFFCVAWASIPKVVSSIPTVARHIFQACPVWIHIQRNTTNIIVTWIHNTNNTEKIMIYMWFTDINYYKPLRSYGSQVVRVVKCLSWMFFMFVSVWL
jgi:hypothetical protein